MSDKAGGGLDVIYYCQIITQDKWITLYKIMITLYKSVTKNNTFIDYKWIKMVNF